jgi:hypothetical protein
VEKWEEEEGVQTTLLKEKIIQCKIQMEMKKKDTQFLIPTKQ